MPQTFSSIPIVFSANISTRGSELFCVLIGMFCHGTWFLILSCAMPTSSSSSTSGAHAVSPHDNPTPTVKSEEIHRYPPPHPPKDKNRNGKGASQHSDHDILNVQDCIVHGDLQRINGFTQIMNYQPGNCFRPSTMTPKTIEPLGLRVSKPTNS